MAEKTNFRQQRKAIKLTVTQARKFISQILEEVTGSFEELQQRNLWEL